jgi:hypothetical protein
MGTVEGVVEACPTLAHSSSLSLNLCGKHLAAHRRDQPDACPAQKACSHGRNPYRCRECEGAGLCEHNRQKLDCRTCNGKNFCGHAIRKALCDVCGGSMLCAHKLDYRKCKDAGCKRESQELHPQRPKRSPLAPSSSGNVLESRLNTLVVFQRDGAQQGAAPPCALAAWLATLHLQDPAAVLDVLLAEQVTLQILPNLNEAQLEKIGIKLGARTAILTAAATLHRAA